jgi:hypothetical protein
VIGVLFEEDFQGDGPVQGYLDRLVDGSDRAFANFSLNAEIGEDIVLDEPSRWNKYGFPAVRATDAGSFGIAEERIIGRDDEEAKWTLESHDLSSISDDFHQDPLSSFAVEFAVEDPFPWAKVERSVRDGDDDLATHDRAFEMGVGIIFESIVPILAVRFLGRQRLEPFLEILVQSRFIVVDEYGSGDVHRVAKEESIPDSGFPKAFFDIGRDMEKLSTSFDVVFKNFPKRFHIGRPCN